MTQPQTIYGLARIVFCARTQRYLLVIEEEAKELSDKESWTAGPPAETLDTGESPEKASLRCGEEEIGLRNLEGLVHVLIPEPVSYTYTSGRIAVCYVAYTIVPDEFEACGTDPQVHHFCWVAIEELFLSHVGGRKMRVETPTLIGHFLAHCKEVLV